MQNEWTEKRIENLEDSSETIERKIEDLHTRHTDLDLGAGLTFQLGEDAVVRDMLMSESNRINSLAAKVNPTVTRSAMTLKPFAAKSYLNAGRAMFDTVSAPGISDLTRLDPSTAQGTS